MSCETLEITVRDTLSVECVCPTNTLEIITRGAQGIPGPAGSIGDLTLAEEPTGLINSVNTIYTTAVDFQTIWVYLNGLRMKPIADFDVTDTNEITFTFAPTTGDTLLVDYIPA